MKRILTWIILALLVIAAAIVVRDTFSDPDSVQTPKSEQTAVPTEELEQTSLPTEVLSTEGSIIEPTVEPTREPTHVAVVGSDVVQSGCFVTPKNSDMNIREEADIYSNVVAVLRFGDKVDLADISPVEGWYRTTSGYIAAYLVDSHCGNVDIESPSSFAVTNRTSDCHGYITIPGNNLQVVTTGLDQGIPAYRADNLVALDNWLSDKTGPVGVQQVRLLYFGSEDEFEEISGLDSGWFWGSWTGVHWDGCSISYGGSVPAMVGLNTWGVENTTTFIALEFANSHGAVSGPAIYYWNPSLPIQFYVDPLDDSFFLGMVWGYSVTRGCDFLWHEFDGYEHQYFADELCKEILANYFVP